jgi:hypothetical protein
MDVKVYEIENVVKAAKALNLILVPGVWIKYIQNGWQIHATSCNCGGSWGWMRPRPSGAMGMVGCVCHTELDESKLMDTKNDSSSVTKKLLANFKITAGDVGKIFYTYPRTKEGEMLSREEFSKLNPVDVGWWVEIDDFDINE